MEGKGEDQRLEPELGWTSQQCSALCREFLIPLIFLKQSIPSVTGGTLLSKFLYLEIR